ncbi:MAG: deoxyribodipyrimidine photolyase [Candidatus Bathyarchaeota archaeon B24]|nr:MAG: deoxyribodipyrimidine photolyase [Candidatus Bathyarchaeota archaeon B24]
MVKEIRVKSVLNRHRRRDPWFLDDYSVNPYRLCGFNCVYCYIRGSRYGAHMGEGVAVKVNAPLLLERELWKWARKRKYGFIALSSSTEPWQPLESRYGVTRRCLEAILRFRFPVHCLTKSKLILRDLDLLTEIDRTALLPEELKKTVNRGVLVTFSLSTLDERVAEIFEPGAPKPDERLEAMAKVKDEGLQTGIAYIPVLPYISDTDEELENMVKAAKEYDADYVFIGCLTLYGVGKTLYYKVLRRYFPTLLPKYRMLFRGSSQPNLDYRVRLEQKAEELCRTYGVRHRLG